VGGRVGGRVPVAGGSDVGLSVVGGGVNVTGGIVVKVGSGVDVWFAGVGVEEDSRMDEYSESLGKGECEP
jgi:hypothetical protein